MNILVEIGKKNNKGQFENDRWNALIEWFSQVCNNIIIYAFDYRMKFYRSKIGRNEIDKHFSENWLIEEEEYPDPSLDVICFRLWGKGLKNWRVIKKLNFDPDCGITHCSFLNDDICIGEFESDDDENYMTLHLTDNHEEEVLKVVPNLEENVEIITRNYEYFSSTLFNGEEWKALGASSKRDLATIK